jgi:tripeptide aminopeptidase
MKEKVVPVKYIVDIAEKAMKEVNIKPLIKPIRGTDGCQLSYKGLPCPNIFAGGHNFHGKYEYVPVESMQKQLTLL